MFETTYDSMFDLSYINKFIDISYCFTDTNIGGQYIYVYVHLFSYPAAHLL